MFMILIMHYTLFLKERLILEPRLNDLIFLRFEVENVLEMFLN